MLVDTVLIQMLRELLRGIIRLNWPCRYAKTRPGKYCQNDEPKASHGQVILVGWKPQIGQDKEEKQMTRERKPFSSRIR